MNKTDTVKDPTFWCTKGNSSKKHWSVAHLVSAKSAILPWNIVGQKVRNTKDSSNISAPKSAPDYWIAIWNVSIQTALAPSMSCMVALRARHSSSLKRKYLAVQRAWWNPAAVDVNSSWRLTITTLGQIRIVLGSFWNLNKWIINNSCIVVCK